MEEPEAVMYWLKLGRLRRFIALTAQRSFLARHGYGFRDTIDQTLEKLPPIAGTNFTKKV